MSRSSILAFIGALGTVIALGHGVARVRAAGALSPVLTYAGTLTSNGSPVVGTHTISLGLYGAASGGASVCAEAIHVAVTLEGGRFRLPLDESCVAAVQQGNDLWVEVKANGVVVGRSQLGAVPTAVLATRALTAGNADTATAAVNGVPPGTIVAFGGETPPAGWLLCDGAGLASATYPNLFAAIGATWGNGAGTAGANFHLPDLRGQFLRGAHSPAGVDAELNRPVGNAQGYETAKPVAGDFTAASAGAHFHNTQRDSSQVSPGGGLFTYYSGGFGGNIPTSTDGAHGHTVTGGGGAETRPKNVAINYIIKY